MIANSNDRPQRNGKATEVLIYGAFGGWNAGDEAILYSVVSMLRDHYQPDKIYMICNRLAAGSEKWYQSLRLSVVTFRQSWKLLYRLTRGQLIVGGGQLLNGDVTLKGLVVCLAMVLINRCFGQRPVLVGVGAEGINGKAAQRLTRMIISASCGAAFRDAHSFNQAWSCSPQNEKLKLTADVVFGGAIRRLVDGGTRSNRQRQRVAIAVHASPRRHYASVDFFLALIGELRDSFPELEIHVVAHDNRADSDVGAMDEIQREFPPLDSEVVYHRFESSDLERSLKEILQLYEDCDAVISARMHPLIIASILLTRPIPIAESGKVQDLARILGLSPLTTADPLSDYCEALRNASKDRHSTIDNGTLESLRKRALQNLQFFSPVMNEKQIHTRAVLAPALRER